MDGKLGTFGGVFTPSLLTILGVIMYLRLPWLIGTAGLFQTLLILAAAHVVSIATGLSVSSIATDKKVGVGGSYYILSRSFGLPIGGAIGLALFVGLAFSVSLHIVGFSESALGSFGIEPTANAIRVCGTITVVAITAMIFVSTSLAIKSQYIILALVGGSLIAVFLGSPTATEPQLAQAPGSPSFGVLFGIFFPAVTGFMAGVNMSGDLRDPKGAIPKGTIAAIAAAAVVYVVLAVFLAYRVDARALRDDPEVLQHFSLSGPAVIAGIWGASLSSALGAILGAPRILQALSTDRITPRVFAVGRGATNEPRNALVLAFAIAECGILIAQLDLIARVVSTVFLALYGAISLTCAIESWANPDFRPKFKIPRLVGIVGAGSALLLMIQLDLLATAGAAALLLGLYGYLKRRQLTLEAGGAWEGIWSTLVRTGLQRLHRTSGDVHSWRPNVMLFDDAGHASHPAIREFASTLASGNGMVTDFAVMSAPDSEDPRVARVGVFDAKLVTDAPLDTIAAMCQHHGFSGVSPNTVLLPWRHHHDRGEAFLRVLAAAASRGLNILLFDEPRAPARDAQPRIDIWWAPGAGNLAFSASLARFITRAPEFERAKISVLIAGEGGDDDAVLRAKATRFLDSARLDARVRVIERPQGVSLHDLVCNESRPADLVLCGLPFDPAHAGADDLDRLDRVAALPGGIVFVRASDAFADVLASPRAPRGERAVAEPIAPAAELALPSHPELAAAMTSIDEHTRARLGGFHDHLVAACAPYLVLCDTARELVVRRADMLIAAAREAHPTRRKRLADRATATFLTGTADALAEIAEDEVAAQATVLAESIAALGRPEVALPAAITAVIKIDRPRADFRASDGDDRGLRRWKRRRRWRNLFRRRIPQAIPIGALARYHADRVVCDELARVIARFRTTSHDLLAEVGRVLATAEAKTHAQLLRGVDDPDAMVTRLDDTRAQLVRRLDGVRDHTRQRLAEDRAALESATRAAMRSLSGVLDRVGAPLLARAARTRAPADVSAIAALPEAATAWSERQVHLLRRVRLAGQLATFTDRLTVAAAGQLDEIVAGVRSSGLRACSELRAALAVAPAPEVRDELPYDPAPAVAKLARAAAAATSELPEAEVLLTDEVAAAIVRGDAPIATATIAVRSTVQGIVETDLIARFGAEVLRYAEADARAWAVARDAVVLIAARPRDEDDDDDGGEQASPVATALDEARGRLDAQIAKIHDVEAAFDKAVLDGIEAVTAATAFDGLCTSLDTRSGRARDRGRPSRVGAVLRRGLAGARDLAARAIYRRSAGVVYARETQVARQRTAEHALRDLAARAAVAPPVLSALPLYYRNLFMGQVNINEAFFVGRADRVGVGAAALRGERPGLRSVLVTGARGAGKTTLCQQIALAAGGDVHWIGGGGATREALHAAFETALVGAGTPSQLVGRLPPGSTIVIDDLDLWWERRPGGLDAIDDIVELVASTADRIGYVLAGGTTAIGVLGALRPLSRVAQTQVVCRPLSARELEQVILARHASTGLKLKLDERESLGPWLRARLFDAHFDYSGGNVGYALRAWIAHVDAFADDVLSIRMPAPLDWGAIDDLRGDQIALLIELLLHKTANAEKLQRLTGRPLAEVRDALAELTAIGLVVHNRRLVSQINPAVHVPVVDWFGRRELA